MNSISSYRANRFERASPDYPTYQCVRRYRAPTLRYIGLRTIALGLIYSLPICRTPSGDVLRLTLLLLNSNLERLVDWRNFIQLSYARQLFRQLPAVIDPFFVGRRFGERSGTAFLAHRLS